MKNGYADFIAPIYEPFIKAVLENNPQRLVLKGGRFSAKGDTTYTMVGIVLSNINADAFIFVPQQTGIKSGVIAQVSKVFNRINLEHKLNLSTNVITLGNGSQLHFKGLDASRTKTNNDIFKGLDSSKEHGVRFLIFDELSATQDFERIETIIATIARQDNYQIIEISNPPRNKRHPIFQRYKYQEQADDYLVITSTVYDLPKKWIKSNQKKYIKDIYKRNISDYRHIVLGLSESVDGLAYDIDDEVIWTDIFKFDDYIDFQIFTDEATVNATTFCLYGITRTGDVHLLNTFYHSSKSDGHRYSPSQYAKKFDEWFDELGIDISYISRIVTDGLPFAMELKNLGYKAKHIGKLKDRALSYTLSNKLILEQSFKIVRDNSNNIFYNQLTNATIIVDKDNKPKVDKTKETGNDNNLHTHALDTFLYFCLANQKQIMKGEKV